MLPLAIFALLAWFLEFARADVFQSKRFVVDTRKSYGLAPRQEIQGAVLNETANPGTGILPLQLSADRSAYYVTISAGGIGFRMALDTASSDLFITSTACETSFCKSVPRYPLTYQSPTFISINDNSTSFNISFVDGTVASGYVARESIKVANLTSSTQAFGVITDSNVTLTDQVSGVLGLGFPRLSTISQSVVNATPYFTSLTQQGLVDYPIFGIHLTQNNTGSLALGAIDATVVQNISNVEWHYVVPFAPVGTSNNVSSYMYWALQLSSISVNRTSFRPEPTYPEATANSSLALLDVGTPGIYGPYDDVSMIYSMMEGSRLVDTSGQWAVPCNTAQTISFSFGGHNFTMQPTDYMIGPTEGDSTMCLSWPRATGPSRDGLDWQLGSAFLRTVYTIFSTGINSKESPIIGLYPLSNTTTPQSFDTVSAFFASESATVATTLPNYVLAPPSYTTPPYAFNTSVKVKVGETVLSELATSTYVPILKGLEASTVPMVSPNPTVQTYIVTSSGETMTQTSVASTSTLPFGVPYAGWKGSGCVPGVPISLLLSISAIFPVFFLLT